MATFTERAWEEIRGIYERTLKHPFLIELADGTLKREKFKYYMIQDSAYLMDYSKALAITAAKADTPEEQIALLDFASFAVDGEHELHEKYFKVYGVQPSSYKSPACFAYTNYMLASAYGGSYAEGVACLLPCAWLYEVVGRHLSNIASFPNPYDTWMEMYSGEEYCQGTDDFVALVDSVAARSSKEMQAKMLDRFVMSSRLEYVFWDDAYHRAEWKI